MSNVIMQHKHIFQKVKSYHSKKEVLIFEIEDTKE